MATIVIRSNLDTASNVLVEDMGFLVPPAGGTETFTDIVNLQDASGSLDLRKWATDAAFPGGSDPSSNTLILNDGTQDIPVLEIEDFLGRLVTGKLARLYNELLAGAVNDFNKVFTTAAQFVPGSDALYFNGQRLEEGVGNDYIRSEGGGLGTGFDTITLEVAPRDRSGSKPNDKVRIDYDPL